MNIAVAGNILSGKTTLAKVISKYFEYQLVPLNRSELNFLDDFFLDVPRYFLPTQTSFLLNKSLEINEKSSHNCNLIIDRSLYEDIHVFAQLWIDNYDIDSREEILYNKLASYILKQTSDIDIYLVCRCSIETLKKRFSERTHRSFENKYPKNYIEQLNALYNNLTFPKHSMVIEINTDMINLLEENSIILLISEINKIIDSHNLLKEKCDYKSDFNWCKIISFGNKRLEHIEKKKPLIYLAAPFTEFANKSFKNNSSKKCDQLCEYNVLPQSYRDFLCECAKIIEYNGKYDVMIPHKHENNWGETYKTSEQIVSSMFYNTKNCDALVAILSTSTGVHMEIAHAISMQKPMLIIIVDELTNGFYAEGIKSFPNVHITKVKTLLDAKSYLCSKDAINFIKGMIS